MSLIHDYTKDFDTWNIRKKATDNKNTKPPLFKERDIWWVSIGVNVGFEQDGKHENFVRPVLIIKKFSRDIFLGIPMSTKCKHNPYYHAVTLQNKTVSVLMSQMRVFSSKRMWNKIGGLDTNDFESVLKRLKEIIFLPHPTNRVSRG